MTRPFVSIVVPVFNRSRLIADAMASLQSQPGVDMDIVVVDDASTDETPDIVRRMAAADARVTLLERPHRGPAAARNAGIAVARGAFLTFVDSDDLCAPGRLLRQASKLRDRPDIEAVIGAMLHFESVDDAGLPRRDPRHIPYHNAALHCAMFRTSEFRDMGPIDETLPYAEDVDVFLRLLERDAGLLLEPEIACFYRCHAGNMTNDIAAKQKGYVKAYARSISRRRASNRTRPIRCFFPAIYTEETEIGGASDGGRY